jgi:hypothetical protein
MFPNSVVAVTDALSACTAAHVLSRRFGSPSLDTHKRDVHGSKSPCEPINSPVKMEELGLHYVQFCGIHVLTMTLGVALSAYPCTYVCAYSRYPMVVARVR